MPIYSHNASFVAKAIDTLARRFFPKPMMQSVRSSLRDCMAPFAAALWCYLPCYASAQPLPASDAASISGLLEDRQGWSTHDGTRVLDSQRLQLDGRWQTADLALTARGHVMRTGKLDTQTMEEGRFDALHADRSIGNCLARAGLQTVVWGRADHLRVLDVVNPMDLREGYFGDWDTKRLPLAMLNTECQMGDHALQLLVIPQSRFDVLPSAQGSFATPDASQVFSSMGIPVTAAATPSAWPPRNWSGGLQWSGRMIGADFTLNAYHGWESSRRIEAFPDGYAALPHRTTMLGGSASAPFGDIVVRSEYALQRNARDYGLSSMGLPVAIDANHRSLLLAVDYTATPWLLSLQASDMQSDGPGSLWTPVRQRVITVASRRSLMHDRLSIGTQLGIDTDRHGYYLLMDAQYEISEDWFAKLSVEQFGGSIQSFGYLLPQNRIWMTFRYAF